MMQKFPSLTTLAILISILLLSNTAISQGIILTTVTPSPAPSKTPTMRPTRTLPTAAVTTNSTNSTLNSTYTQQDLKVLTGNVQRPNGAAWYNGKLFTACNGDWTLYELDDTTGSTVTYIYGIRNTHSMYIEPGENNNLNLWVPDFEMNSLFRVNPRQAPQAIANQLNGPWGISSLNQDHFLVTNLLGHTIVSISRSGEIHELTTDLRSPTGIASDDNFIYFANNGSSRRAVEWFSIEDAEKAIEDGSRVTPKPLISGLQSTTGVVLASDGFLYFSYSLGTRGVVGRVNPEQCREDICTNDEVEIVLYSELAAPLAGLTITPDMRLFVHTIFKPEIYWVQLDSNP